MVWPAAGMFVPIFYRGEDTGMESSVLHPVNGSDLPLELAAVVPAALLQQPATVQVPVETGDLSGDL
jgi:hypothetical protein